MTSLKAILWDNDGVLVNTESLYFEANRRTLAGLNLQLDARDYETHFLRSDRGLLQILPHCGFSDEQITEVRAKRDKLYDELLQHSDVAVTGVRETLQRLRNLRHAIVTSSRRHHIEEIHSRTQLLPHFEIAIAREDYLHSKPNPEPYLLALEKLGLRAEECLVVEDSERGLRAATAAGLRCWILANSLSKSSDFSSAERILHSIDQVAEHILGS